MSVSQCTLNSLHLWSELIARGLDLCCCRCKLSHSKKQQPAYVYQVAEDGTYINATKNG